MNYIYRTEGFNLAYDEDGNNFYIDTAGIIFIYYFFIKK